MTRWLVTGAGGMLGQDLLTALGSSDVVGLRHADLDITDAAAVKSVLHSHAPSVVVNCAAYTRVDDAEADEATALRLNGDGVRNLAAECASLGARLIHVSTDYVFAGDASAPYTEDAPTGPRSAYGRTKLVGEQAVLELLPEQGVVVRTAWLYGAHGGNFVRTMIRLEGEKDTLSVVGDQRGQPTWTVDVAERLVALGNHPSAHGVFHATSSGETTWFGLTREIFRLLGADPERVQPTTTDKFPRPAPRPAYSVLGHGRWAEAGIEPIQDWKDALEKAFPALV
ncbi:SDR family oxidoreductase [Flindersiella endophytica]